MYFTENDVTMNKNYNKRKMEKFRRSRKRNKINKETPIEGVYKTSSNKEPKRKESRYKYDPETDDFYEKISKK